MMHKTLTLLAAGALVLAACGDGGGDGDGDAEDEELPEVEAGVQDGTAVIPFWHAMSGGRGDVVDELIEDFNATQDDVQIHAEFRGSYEETLTSAVAAYRAGNPPGIVQMYEVGTQTMLDSEAIVPVYELAPEAYDWGSVNDATFNYYSVDEQMHCMPFNSSTAMLYYNKDMFEEAGLDPEQPPETAAELEQMGSQILQDTEARGAISFGWPAWILEQMHALHGELYANNDNGRSGLADELLVDGELGVDVLTTWQRWADEDLLVYGGREYDANDPFVAGEFAMLAQSTSSLASIQADAEFDVGTGYLPLLDDYPGADGGSVIGGGCLWVFDGLEDEVYDGAWEFFDYLSQTEQDIQWHKETGYFPASEDAHQQLVDEGWFEEQPNFATAFEQISESGDSPAARGALLGNFVQIRDIVGVAIEEVLTQGSDPDDALNDAADESNRVLGEYVDQHGG